jgi:hypothetical protein
VGMGLGVAVVGAVGHRRRGDALSTGLARSALG